MKYKIKGLITRLVFIFIATFSYGNKNDSTFLFEGSIEELDSIGYSAYLGGNYVVALECFSKILEKYQDQKNNTRVYETLIFIAEIHRGAHALELGLRKLDDVELRIKKDPITTLNAYLQNRKAAIFYELGRHGDAILSARKSNSIEKKLTKDRPKLASNLNIIGASHRELGNIDSAAVYLRKSIKLAEESGDVDDIIETTYNLGLLFYQFSKNDSALYYLNKAKTLCVENSRAAMIYHVFNAIAENYEAVGNIKAAYRFKVRQITTHDSVINEKAFSKFLKISQASDNIYNLREKERAQLNKERQKRVILTSFVVIALLSIIASMAYRSRERVKRLNKELVAKTEGLDKKNTELEELNELKNKLFSLLAHDLRSPVASLSGLLNLLEDEALDDEQRRAFTNKLRLQFDNTEQLLSSIVTWSKSQITGGELNLEEAKLGDLIEKEILLLSQNAKVKGIKIEFLNSCPSPIKTDVNVISAIIRNLLNNALKFTSKNGFVEVGCKLYNDNSYSFWVKDNGVGMSKEKITQLFTGQTKSTPGTRKEKGSGIGLMICHDFAQMLNAEIKVESQEGLGSTFTVVFPAL